MTEIDPETLSIPTPVMEEAMRRAVITGSEHRYDPTPPVASVDCAELHKSVQSVRGYAKAWRGLHRDISDDFTRVADAVDTLTAQARAERERVAEVQDVLRDVLSWWPVNSENAERFAKQYGSDFAASIQRARAALASDRRG